MGIPVDWKPERAIQPKEGLKRRLQSELSVLHQALSSAISKDVIRPVILLRKQGVGRKTDDLWVITELGNSGCRVHIAIRIDFSFCAQLPLSRNCFPMYSPFQAHFQSIKVVIQINCSLVFIFTVLFAKTSEFLINIAYKNMKARQ